MTDLAQIPALRALHAQQLAADFRLFARAAWPVVFPGRPLAWSPAYDFLCEVLTLVARRDPRFRRVIVNIAPRCAKSFFCTICFPVWSWISEPGVQYVCASYSMDLSTEHSIARRNLIQSPWFQRLFADRFQLSGDRNTTTQFANDKRGQMLATSTGARLMGFGFDLCVADDLTSPTMALSDSERSGANKWFDDTLRQRGNDPATAAIIVISQRVHEMDVPGFLLESEPGVWTHVKIPLVAEESQRIVFPISGRVWERPRGDVLQPERFTPAVIEELKRRRLVFSAQFQQNPAPLEGNLIKRSDVRYYGGVDPVTGQADEKLPETFDLEIVSVDCAFKDLATSDYVAIARIGVKGSRRYILNLINAHLGLDATEAAIRREREGRSISAVLVEDKANGSAIIERLRRNVSGVQAINPEGGKLARMFAASPEWSAGDWYVDRNAAWTEPFLEQITKFPNARHDDMADSMSQAAVWLQQRGGTPSVVEFWKQQIAEHAAKKSSGGRELSAEEAGLRNCARGLHSYKGDRCEFCDRLSPNRRRVMSWSD